MNKKNHYGITNKDFENNGSGFIPVAPTSTTTTTGYIAVNETFSL